MKKSTIAIIAAIIAVVTTVAIIVACTWTSYDKRTTSGNLDVATLTQGKNINLAAVAAPSGGITLTATITPASATDKSVNWTTEFVNGSSAWATSKNSADYVSVTPTSDGSLTANVTSKQAFGEQVKVIATSRVNALATCACIVDYGARLNVSATMTFDNALFAPSRSISSSGIQKVESVKGFMWQGMQSQYIGGKFDYKVEYNPISTKPSANATVAISCKPTNEFYNALNAQGIARATNEFVAPTTQCNGAIYETLTSALLIPRNGQDPQFYANINKFNAAILACSGIFDFEICVTTTTDYEAKSYIFQCLFNRNGAAFTPTSLTLSDSSIVL